MLKQWNIKKKRGTKSQAKRKQKTTNSVPNLSSMKKWRLSWQRCLIWSIMSSKIKPLLEWLSKDELSRTKTAPGTRYNTPFQLMKAPQSRLKSIESLEKSKSQNNNNFLVRPRYYNHMTNYAQSRQFQPTKLTKIWIYCVKCPLWRNDGLSDSLYSDIILT